MIELYDEDLRERLLSREQIQKLDLVTQTILFTMQSIMTKYIKDDNSHDYDRSASETVYQT